MADFMSELGKTINTYTNMSVTENGAIGYKTTNNPLVDLNFKVSSYRDKSEVEIIKDFEQAFILDPLLSVKWLFYVRDIRGGLGERRLFRILIKHLANNYPEVVKKNINNIPEYGRYDDVTYLYFEDTKVRKEAFKFIAQQLAHDYMESVSGNSISLLAKWLPSPRGVANSAMKHAKQLRIDLGYTEQEYRKILTKLRENINIVENFMSNKKWDKIKYETVPSKAHLKYKAAFKRHDTERYNNFISNHANMVKSKTLYPYEIVCKYMQYLRLGKQKTIYL